MPTFDGTDQNDTLEGGVDNDTLNGAAGDDSLVGGDGNDRLTGDVGSDTLQAGAGDDYLRGDAGDDTLDGGAGTDTVSYSNENGAFNIDLAAGTAVNRNNNDTDTLISIEHVYGSQFGDDSIVGSSSHNFIFANLGADTVQAGAGDDTLEGYHGDDTLDGGTGSDVAFYRYDEAGVTVDLGAGTATDGNNDTDTLISLEDIDGSQHSDRLTGSNSDNEILGNGGNDSIDGGLGDDSLAGGADNDVINGNEGRDTLLGDLGDDTLSGQADNDSLDGGDGRDILDGGDGNDTLTGGAGADTLSGSTGTDELTGGADKDTFVIKEGDGHSTVTDFSIADDVLDLSAFAGLPNDIQTIASETSEAGTTGVLLDLGGGTTVFLQAMDLTGLSQATILRAGVGQNITGDASNELLNGTANNDTIEGNGGHDTINGQDGDDQLHGTGGGDSIDGGNGQDQVNGNDGDDFVSGGAGDDTVRGQAGNDELHGDDGNDLLEGGDGNDTLYGEAGDETIYGGAGDDHLNGQAGNATLEGGAGNDGFFVDLREAVNVTITDFNTAEDRLDLFGFSSEADAANAFNNLAQVGSDAVFTLGGTTVTLLNTNTSDLDSSNVGPAAYLTGTSGDDTLSASGNRTHLFGGAGNDSFVISDQIGFVAIDDFVPGSDVIDLSSTNVGLVDFDAVMAAASQDAYGNVDITVGQGTLEIRQTLLADLSSANFIYGTAPANQNITGNETDELLVGGAGNDTIEGNGGADTLRGGQGDDVLHGTGGNDSVEGGDGNDQLNGNADNDTLRGENGNDSVAGQAGDDELHGDAGDDTLYGNDGNDNLFGGGGSDHMDGGEGNDHLNGQGGNDTLVGGGGNDNFFIDVNQTGNRVIQDFDPNSDSIDFYGFSSETDAQNLLSTAVQNGADTVINLGSDSVTLLNVNVNDLSSSNFTGIAVHRGTESDDTLTAGGTRADLEGRGGADTFVIQDLTGFVAINDFVSGTDKIDLSGTSLGLTDFAAIQAAATDNGSHVDIDGGTGTLRIYNNNIGNLSASDFVFGGAVVGQNIVGTANADSLTGGAAADTIEGNDGDDTIHAGDGNDQAHGTGGNDYVDGGRGDDTLNGNDGDDTVFGQEGADVVHGQAGNDQVHGMDGNDTVYGDEGDDYVGGEGGHDSLIGGDGNDFLQGHAGDDTIDGGAGADWVLYYDQAAGATVDIAAGTATDGDNGTDKLINIENAQGSNTGADLLQGDNNANTMRGWGGNDTLVGREGNDALLGDDGDDSLVGGLGDDYVRGGAGADTMDGGEGTDRVSYWIESGDITVDLEAGTASGVNTGNDTLISVESVTGSNTGNDTLTGSSVANLLDGAGGNDSLVGAAGDDTLTGQAGNDILTGGTGNDRFVIDGGSSDIIRDFTSGDILEISTTIIADYSAFVAAAAQNGADINVDLGNSHTLTLQGVTLASLSASDFAFIAPDSQTLTGTGANDVLTGGAGNDTLFGDAGNDTLTGGAGDDSLNGGDGIDTANYFQDGAAVSVDLGAGTASGSASGTDTLLNIEDVNGTDIGNDSIVGDGEGNLLQGAGGDDTIDGADGNDHLAGDAGNDLLLGNAGLEDTLTGGAGNDTLDGGAGFNRVDYYNAGAAVNVNLSTGQAFDGQGGTDTILNVSNITGSNAGNDTLIGTATTNIIDGHGGNDSIDGGEGIDTVSGGAGADRFVISGTSPDYITDFNAADNDVIEIPSSIFADFAAFSAAATDNAGTLEVNMGNGNTLYLTGVSLGSLSASNFEFTNVVAGQVITGTSAGSVHTGGDGPDTIFGAGGSDTLIGGRGDDSLDGGGDHATYDVLSYENDPSGANVNLAAGTAIDGYGDTDTIANFVTIKGSSTGSDTLRGDTSTNVLEGGGGNDYLLGDDGDDFLQGASGDDTLDGGSGFDTADYRVVGQTGVNVKVDLAAGTATSTLGDTDTLISIEGAQGTIDGDDTLLGDGAGNNLRDDGGRNLLDGAGGNDTITGGSGDDSLLGGDGNDSIHGGGGDGADTLVGGAGNDTLNGFNGNDRFIIDGLSSDTITFFVPADDIIQLPSNIFADFAALSAAATDNAGDLVIDLGGGHTLTLAGIALGSLTAANFDLTGTPTINTVTGTSGAEVLNGTDAADLIEGREGNDTIYGAAGNDTLRGEAGNDEFFGGDGADVLEGGDGDDNMFGEGGDDTLYGGAGNDHLNAQAGNATLVGGTGSDGFWVDLREASSITITDFDITTDRLNVFGFASEADAAASMGNFAQNGADAVLTQGGVTITLQNTTASDLTIHNYEAITYFGGTDGDDTLTAAGSRADMAGRGGNDTFVIQDIVSFIAIDDFVPGSEKIDLSATALGLVDFAAIQAAAVNNGTNVEIRVSTGTLQIRGHQIADLSASDFIFGGPVVGQHKIGTSGNDSLTGGDADDTLEGLDGNDTLASGLGSDTLDGGAGFDTARYVDVPTAVLVDLAAGTVTHASGAVDRLTSIELVEGSNAGADTFIGSSGSDEFWGYGGNDTIVGNAGDDFLIGMAGDDSLVGGDGNDSHWAHAGADTIDGGAGTDRVSYYFSPNGVHIDLSAGIFKDGYGTEDTLISIENLSGSASGDDTLVGTGEANLFHGYGGGDSFDGAGGTDTVDYQHSDAGVTVNLGANTASGGHATGDSFANIENLIGSTHDDALTGDSGNNTLEGRAGADALDGGDGADTADYASSDAAVNVKLSAGTASGGDAVGDSFTSIENLSGSSNNDTLTGDGNSNVLSGAAGNDQLSGGDGDDGLNGNDGNDMLLGEGGNDYLQGHQGDDTLDGGTGTDWASFHGATVAGVTASLVSGTASGGSDIGQDTLISIENLAGTALNDSLEGDNNNNAITGYYGNDTLRGLGGDDLFVGAVFNNSGSNNNVIDGGDGFDTVSYQPSGAGVTVNLAAGVASDNGFGGSDTLISIEAVEGSGGADNLTGDENANRLSGLRGGDTLTGNGGSDTFVISGANPTSVTGFPVPANSDFSVRITDFSIADGDILDLSGTDIGASSNQALFDLATEISGGVEVSLGQGSTLTIMGISRNDLHSINLIGGDFSGLDGTDGNDHLVGNNGSNSINGLAGDDTIEAGGGIDYLIGGDGADIIDGGEGADTAEYRWDGAGGISVDLQAGTATDGFGKTDTLRNIEHVSGTDSPDTIVGDTVGNSIWGRGGNDTLVGGDETITDDGFEDDHLWGGEGDDSIVAGGGDDYLRGDQGTDTLDGGTGTDRVSYYGSTSGVHVNLATGVASDGFGTTDTLISIENASGSNAGDDTIIGNDGNNKLTGYGGADILDGAGGVDIADYRNSSEAIVVDLAAGTVAGGNATGDTLISIESIFATSQNDIVTGDAGANLLDGWDGNDSLVGGAGGDTLIGRAGHDTLDGGDGYDWVSYRYDTSGVTVDIGAGTATDGSGNFDTLISIENVFGSDYADTVTGTDSTNFLDTYAGNDVVRGAGGDDTIDGGDGNDTIDGGAGVDYANYFYHSGNVTADLAAGTATDGFGASDLLISIENIFGSDTGADSITGDGLANSLHGSGGDDTLHGGDGNDTLYGDADNDALAGGAGNDTLDGGTGSDTLEGQAGADYLDGAAGNDLLDGGADDDSLRVDLGDDTMTGGAGADVFTVSTNSAGNVVITDFDPNADHLSLHNFETEAAAANALSSAVQNGSDAVFTFGSTTVTVQNTNVADFQHGNYEAFATLLGTPGDDTIVLSGGRANTDSGTGSDTIVLQDIAAYITLLNFDPTNDKIDLSATALGLTDLAAVQALARDVDGNVQIDVQSGVVQINGVTVSDLTDANFVYGGAVAGKNITGTAQADNLQGGAGDDTIEGQASNDTLYGNGGHDEIHGGLDNDIIFGGVGNDTLVGNADNDTLFGGDGADSLLGEAGDDNPQGEAGNDTLSGGDGNDTVQGGADNDIVDGGEGDDIVYGDAGDDSVVGGAGNDVVRGVEGDDTVRGQDGDDYVRGDEGADILDGGAGTDRVSYYGSPTGVHVDLGAGIAQDGFGTTDTLISIEEASGSATGNDTLIGTNEDNRFHGYGGGDSFDGAGGTDLVDYQHSDAAVNINLATGAASGGHATGDSFTSIEDVTGSAHNDTLVGDAGRNTFAGLAGADSIDGGDHHDFVDYTASDAAVTVNFTAGTASGGHAEGDTLISIENIRGSSHNDAITGDAEGNGIDGQEGDDTLVGLAGEDWLNGMAGNDVLLAGDGNDTMFGGDGNDTIDGGTGADQLTYLGELNGVTVNLEAGTATDGAGFTDTLVSIENLRGSQSNDALTGSSEANYIWGDDGDDTIVGGDEASTGDGVETDHLWGGAGNDSINAGGGDDYLRGDAGNDTLDGGAGSDRVSYYNSTSGVTINLAAGTAVDGLGTNDTLISIENASGSNNGDDSIVGDAGANKLSGYSGADTLDGAGGSDTVDYQNSDAAVTVNLATGSVSGGHAEGDVLSSIENIIASGFNDALVGGAEASKIDGRAGDDTLTGNDGNDTLTGGTGADTFVVDATSSDTITDFVAADGDIIDLKQSGLSFFTLQNIVDAATENGGNTTINLGNGETLTLEGVAVASLAESNFVFADNVAPSGADITVTTDEDIGYALKTSDFGFSDPNPGAALANVRIDNAVPGLELSGAQVAIGQVVSVGDVVAGNLVYTPPLNVNGDAVEAILFSVGDGGLFATSPSTMTVNVTPQNDAPTASASTITAVEDTPFVFSAGNFGFADVDALSTFVSVEIVSPISGLTLNNVSVTNNQVIGLSDISAGNLVYTPPQDVNGQGIAGLTYRVSDGIAQSDPSTLPINVLGVNDTPTVSSLATDVTVLEDTASNIPLSSITLADVDAGSAAISVFLTATSGTLAATSGSGVTASSSGSTLTLSGTVDDLNSYLRADGNVQYTGAENESGDNKDTIVITANDGGNSGIGSAVTVFLGIVNVDITAVNDAPVAVADAVSAGEDAAIFINVLTNDTDPDGDALTVSLDTTGTTGTVTLLNANTGAVSYDPNGLFDGLFEGQTQTDKFQYTVSDGAESRTETVTVTINGEGTLVASLNSVTENIAGASVGTISSASGFTPLSAGSGDVFTSSDSRFEIAADGAIKLKDGVSLDYETETSVELVVTRTKSGGDQETLDLTVTVADAPSGSAQDGFIAKALVFIDTNGNGTFDDGTDPWTTTDAGGNFELPQGVNGTLILQGGINPKTGEQAIDISTQLPFNGTLTAPSGSTVLTPLTTLIEALVQNGDSVADAESKVGDAFGISPAVDLTTFDPINAALTGDTEGSKVFAAGSQVLSTVVLTKAVVEGASGSNGDDAAFAALANVVSNASGTVDLGDNTVIDGVIDTAGTSAGANTAEVNEAKTAATAIITATNENVESSVTSAGSDTKAALTTVTQTAIVAQGDAATNLGSAVGDTGALGAASTNYTGGNLTTAVGSAVVGTIEPGRIFTGTSAAEVLNGAGGDDTLRGLDGDDTLDGKDGTDLFVIDGSSSDTIASFVSAEEIDLTATRTYGLDFSGSGDTLVTGSKVVQSGDDTVLTLGNGETLTLKDVTATTLTASNFKFAVNAAPTATGATITINEDTPRAISTSDLGFADTNGDSLDKIRIDSLPAGAGGTLKLNNVDVTLNQEIAVADIAGGLLVFTPAENANGNALANFTFSVNDGTTYSTASSTITFNVTPQNDAPVAGNVDLGATSEDTAAHISTASLVANTTDQENDSLSITSLTLQNSAHGSVVDNGNGSFTYTPASEYSGNDVTLNFTVSDGNGGTDTATAVIDVNDTNDAPQGANQTLTATSSILSLSAGSFGYSDADNDALNSVTIVTVPNASAGVLSLNGGSTALTDGAVVTRAQLDAGNLVFVAANGASGDAAASFSFRVHDGVSNSVDTNTATININALPTGTDGSSSIQTGTVLTLREGSFGFSDVNAADSLSVVRIDSATPGLALNGTAVQAGDDIAVASIRAGQLKFTPQSGDTNVVISFSVNDGTAYAATPSSLTISVTQPSGSVTVTPTPPNSDGGSSGGDSSGNGSGDSSGGSTPDVVGDTLSGGVSADVIVGGSADDIIDGGAGGDRLRGGDGNDSIAGGTGNDEVFAGEGDTGNDTLQGNLGDDILGGGAGSDLLVGGDVGENLDPNSLNDAGSDTLFGGDGDDFIVAGSFDTATRTVLNTGVGDNLIWAGTGDDTIFGDDQSDILGGGFGSDFINAGGGNDVLYGGKGAASDNHDTLSGGGGSDAIFASLGEDDVAGGAGNDTLFGGAGNDTVSGGADDDQIWGGTGSDTLSGGAGNDTFAFVSGFGQDVISDFATASGNRDILDLTGVDGLTLNELIAGADFSGGNTRLTVTNDDTILLQGITETEFNQLLANNQILAGE